jgi:F-type H+-transporting ATPase subunit delta
MKVSPASYAAALYEATHDLKGQELEAALGRFVQLLADRGMLGKADKIIAAYTRYADEKAGRVRATLESARPLDEATVTHLATLLRQRVGTEVVFDQTINPELLGGARILIGDVVIDTSVAGALNQLRTTLRTAA